MNVLKTPVLIITYRRLDSTLKVLQSIAKVKPEKLYVASNAPDPFNQEDISRVNKVRHLFEKEMDWPCKITLLYRTKHLAARDSISSSITWFFEQEEEGIILEDDCIVDSSFYFFAQECLEKYRYTNKVMQIGASNFQQGKQRGDASYYFSRYNHIWGWAGWRRSWNYFDLQLKTQGKEKFEENLRKLFTRKQDRTYWLAIYDYVISENINTWDYQWMFAIWSNGGCSITPQVNLVENVGFGKDATNTLSPTKFILSLEQGKLHFPVIHPLSTGYNDDADLYTSDNFYHINKSYKSRHLKIKVATILPLKTKNFIKKLLPFT